MAWLLFLKPAAIMYYGVSALALGREDRLNKPTTRIKHTYRSRSFRLLFLKADLSSYLAAAAAVADTISFVGETL